MKSPGSRLAKWGLLLRRVGFPDSARAALQEGWVIANHILVSFHVAFISSVLAIPGDVTTRAEVLRFIFFSPETVVSALFTWLVFHSAIALHELGHFLEAARLRALNESIQGAVESRLQKPLASRIAYLAGLFVAIPYGRAEGIRKEGLNYYPDAPYNLAVAAAGPRASRNVALIALPVAAALITPALLFELPALLNPGRLALGLGLVCGLDFLLADPGKYREFRRRERQASEAAASLPRADSWQAMARDARQRLVERSMQEATHSRLGTVRAPWQFRNCGMGGRHTEKEYPESNISMQEAMFLILGAVDTREAQEMTIRLQTRLKEILEKAEGCRVMGIGLEGGIAPYVDRGTFELPELRLWSMMKQSIEECGYRPGHDVAIALDPALTELEIAYREEFDVPDSVGMYLFWRDHAKKVMDRDAVLGVYRQAIERYDIPILSIEDGFSEFDHQGWRMLQEQLGDRLLVVGDDLVTTNDRTIETATDQGLVNSALIKANQIGTLYETLLAILVSLGKGLQLIVSHRSKSPNDDMEAHLALATNALGLKCGGGANTERLVKYQAVAAQMERVIDGEVREPETPGFASVERIKAREEPTNAGIPTVGVDIRLAIPGASEDRPVRMSFHGATPLGTSAGSGEAVHLVDRTFERAEFIELAKKYRDLLHETEPGVLAFNREVTRAQVEAADDSALLDCFKRAARYGGKGCLYAVDHVHDIVAPFFESRDIADWTLLDIDRALLQLELSTARRRGKLAADAAQDEQIRVMQRKQNLGMNAILSTSLALARGMAHIRGQELYEFLREQLLVIIERLAAEHGVAIEGSRFSNYLDALRAVNRKLEQSGGALFEALRDSTGIYREAEPERVVAAPRVLPVTPLPEAEPPFSIRERKAIGALNRSLAEAYADAGTKEQRNATLRCYLEAVTVVGRRYRMFEIANNRVIRSADCLLVPYDAHGRITVHEVSERADRVVAQARLPHGTIVTDRLIADLAGRDGEVVDLRNDIYDLQVENMPTAQMTRLRDLASLLRRLNGCGSRHEAGYLIRFLVARLCSSSYRGFHGAKNLQPELATIRNELIEFQNGPFARRLRLPTRVLVRSISGLVSQPKLIDEVWQDTIDLAEVHVRGSAICNELRRSTHHALGNRTLALAEAYLEWLESGAAQFPDPTREVPGEADTAARSDPAVREVVKRIVHNLGRLLGSAQIATRINEWRTAYNQDLLGCESTNSISQELESLVEYGIAERNRWVYQHRLRSLASKARSGHWAADVREPFARCLVTLQNALPDDEGFPAAEAEHSLRLAVNEFVTRILHDHQDPLFEALDTLLDCYRRGLHFETFERSCKLRRQLEKKVGAGVFESQRYLLTQLDCILEELGFVALRHVASGYEENGLDLVECLRVINLCAGNLGRDGLHSRELWDLSVMLVNRIRTPSELLDVLAHVQRNYHRLVHRVSEAYEVMAERLGYRDSEMRTVLGNFQRTLHDLNSLVHFTDLARGFVSANEEGLSRRVSSTRGEKPWDFIHLSHEDDIARRIESWDEVSLQGRYGGKGCGLIYISYLGIPTRDAFIIPTVLPRLGLQNREQQRFDFEVMRHVRILEEDILRNEGSEVRLGDPDAPLLLAVRGGSVFSMPGMLTTIVFTGMTDEVALALAREDEWFAWDAYRRFLASYAMAIWQFDLEDLDLVEKAKRRHGVALKTDLPGSAMREVVEESKTALREAGWGEPLEAILSDPELQLKTAIRAVFDSWDADRARRYRDIKHLSEGWNTAAIVQQMAAGNRSNTEELKPGMDERTISLTGVIPRTRMTESGIREFTGDVKFSACGDDLVGGLTAAKSFEPVEELRSQAPMLERKLTHVSARLRRFLGSDAEIEFTVERGVLSVLQTRSAQVETRFDPLAFDDPGASAGRGIGISGTAFRGVVVFNAGEARAFTDDRSRLPDEVDGVLLVLENPVPDEIPLILSVDGLLAARGGSTSHAAVAVHGIEEKRFTAVLGVPELRVHGGEATLVDGNGTVVHTVRTGDVLSIHGQTGEVYVGPRELVR
jgi:enolase